jgi:hypothetical protein
MEARQSSPPPGSAPEPPRSPVVATETLDPRYLRWLVRLSLLLLLAAATFFAVLIARQNSRHDGLASSVGAYLDARSHGDAAKACAQLSPGEQQELVARLEAAATSQASAADCPRVVTAVSERSLLTPAELRNFDRRPISTEVQSLPGSGIEIGFATPEGLPGPRLPAWKRDGRWQLDEAAVYGAGVVSGCMAIGRSRSWCACAFDQIRARNPGAPQDLDRFVRSQLGQLQAGGQSPLLLAVAQACQGAS